MKKQILITTIMTCMVFMFSVFGVNAQASLSGDFICGKDANSICTFRDGKKIIDNFVTYLIGITFLIFGAVIGVRLIFAFKAKVEGNGNALAELRSKLGNALLGLIIFLLIMSGLFVVALEYLSVQPWAIPILKLLTDSFIPHAYAADQLLPNPLGTNNLYDLILLLVRLVIRWFVFPAVLIMWIWSGFAYVAAQGNPEKISKAHNWLLWAFVSTVIIMVTEGFLFAIRDTVQSIFK